MSSRSADHIAVLTRFYDMDEELAHRLRVLAHKGQLTEEQLSKAVALVRQHPKKEEK